MSTLQNKRANGTVIDGWTYTYDAAGRITSISDGTEIWSYTYDKQGQLLTETEGTGDDARTWTYTYDSGGNLRSVTSPPVTLGPIQPPWPWPPIIPMGEGDGEGSDRSGQEIHITVTYSYGNAQWPDLLTAYNGQPISYDAIGNPTEWYDGSEMTWERGRQLASISEVNGVHGELSFWYNADGLRLGKAVDDGESYVEHLYTWQGGTLIAEAFGDTELEFFYDESGQPYALLVRDLSGATPTEAWYFYVTNLQGDVVMLLDASGNIVAEYSYNAWGKVLEATGAMADMNPIRYRGYYYDAETGLYYLQSRYYDPEVGRFINADAFASTGQGILGSNMFAYCGNEPIDATDSLGSFWNRATEWTDGKYNEQLQKAPPRRAVVFYYVRPDGEDFSVQATDQFAYLEGYTKIIRTPFTTSKQLINAWKNMPETDDVFVYIHGKDGSLRFFEDEKLYDMSQLSSSKISGNIYLFACHGYDVAHELAAANNCPVVSCAGYVSYEQVFGYSYAFAGGRKRNWLIGHRNDWYVTSSDGQSTQLIGNCLIPTAYP